MEYVSKLIGRSAKGHKLQELRDLETSRMYQFSTSPICRVTGYNHKFCNHIFCQLKICDIDTSNMKGPFKYVFLWLSKAVIRRLPSKCLKLMYQSITSNCLGSSWKISTSGCWLVYSLTSHTVAPVACGPFSEESWSVPGIFNFIGQQLYWPLDHHHLPPACSTL